ncbi:MAG: CotS family spore coat protein [Bacillota bacterium]|nr:CotS family spore coat protein [Bacillota bacterium]
MEFDKLKYVIEDNYGLTPKKIEKIKNIFKITCDNGTYTLKVIPYSKERLNFILGAYKHLIEKGLKEILDIIKTKNGCDFIEIDQGYAYLNKFFESRVVSYDNPFELSLSAKALGRLHKFSRGFKINEEMDIRALWGLWPLNFKNKERDILSFKKEISKKKEKTDFDLGYLSLIDDEVVSIEQSLEKIINSNYESLMKEEVVLEGFCHHDFAHHNILINNDLDMKIIDFDYVLLDSHLHDLASLIIRKMRYNKWSIEDALFIMKSYNSEYRIIEEELEVMDGFIQFPQDFWQVGIQYYIEKQPWGEDFFNKKIEKIYLDREGKANFINKFNKISYKQVIK